MSTASGPITTESQRCQICGDYLFGSDIVVHPRCLTLKQIAAFEKFSASVDKLADIEFFKVRKPDESFKIKKHWWKGLFG